MTSASSNETDFVIKQVLHSKIKTDGGGIVISPANETYRYSNIIRPIELWTDVPVSPSTASNFTQVVMTNIYSSISGLTRRAWKLPDTSCPIVPPSYNASFTPRFQWGTTNTDLNIDLYPFTFDYTAGVLTFLNTIPPLSGSDTMKCTAFKYTGSFGPCDASQLSKGTVNASLMAASQPNITSLGNLTSLSVTGNVTTGSSGRLGIGTASPQRELHVEGNVFFTGGLYQGSANSPFINSQWTSVPATSNLYFTTTSGFGNVGIGVSQPLDKLSVDGAVSCSNIRSGFNTNNFTDLHYFVGSSPSEVWVKIAQVLPNLPPVNNGYGKASLTINGVLHTGNAVVTQYQAIMSFDWSASLTSSCELEVHKTGAVDLFYGSGTVYAGDIVAFVDNSRVLHIYHKHKCTEVNGTSVNLTMQWSGLAHGTITYPRTFHTLGYSATSTQILAADNSIDTAITGLFTLSSVAKLGLSVSSGNVGIGLSSSNSQFTLDVGGNLGINGTQVISSTRALSNVTTVTATGNVSGGNLTTGGVVSATGNITGGNLTTTGVISTNNYISGISKSTTSDLHYSIGQESTYWLMKVAQIQPHLPKAQNGYARGTLTIEGEIHAEQTCTTFMATMSLDTATNQLVGFASLTINRTRNIESYTLDIFFGNNPTYAAEVVCILDNANVIHVYMRHKCTDSNGMTANLRVNWAAIQNGTVTFPRKVIRLPYSATRADYVTTDTPDVVGPIQAGAAGYAELTYYASTGGSIQIHTPTFSSLGTSTVSNNRLDVNGNIGINGTTVIDLSRNLNVGTITASGAVSVGGSILADASRNLSNVGTITASGAVSVGGSILADASRNLSNVGNINFSGSILQNGNVLSAGAWAGTTSTGPVWWNGTGNVGIGTNNPTSGKLQVVGNLYVGSGNITTTGDITAFASDERLKTNVGCIKDPISVLSQINGFKYTFNSTANKYGFVDSNVHIGLGAQAVNKVLPEVIRPAPFDWDPAKKISISGENYLTIQYEKLVPVLVEAIKDITKRIDTIQDRLEVVETKLK